MEKTNIKSINPKKKSALKGHILAVVLTVVIFAIADYVLLFPYNIQSPTTWGVIVFLILLFTTLDWICTASVHLQPSISGGQVGNFTVSSQTNIKSGFRKYFIFAAVGIVAIGILIYGYSSTMLHAKAYANLAGETIETRNFTEDVAPSETIANISLMDTQTAQIVGSRALGSLTDLVSQFEINNVYTQINLGGKPKKVTPLEYADFFKYFANMSTGIPGYISVDPVLNTSEYVKLATPMLYAESSYFDKDLMRKLRFSYRTAMFGNVYFEIGEDGTPYYIAPVLKHTIGLFGGQDVKGAVTLNACTGETTYYDKAEIPRWIDIVYDGAMLTERYDWYGLLSGGFLNSVFANKDCKRVTADFGYKMFDDDVWVFTGVTSLASDQSNIGFVLMNSRTAEIRYYAIPGAEEYSVMRSAEGEVQNLGYTASFPSVINIDNQPTYIMVLKDKGSLVKQYALIHVERYNVVVTATTQREAISKYRAALASNGITSGNTDVNYVDPNSVDVRVSDIKYLTIDGNSWAYLISDKGELYKMIVSQDEKIVLVKPGDSISASISEDAPGIYSILDFKMKK
ncbi:MAG: hypothetical protein RSC76_01315 [Oscillospiraceae bacterium]